MAPSDILNVEVARARLQRKSIIKAYGWKYHFFLISPFLNREEGFFPSVT
jgi:hypothetical protein